MFNPQVVGVVVTVTVGIEPLLVMVTVMVSLQVLASVEITVYGPAAKPLCVAPLRFPGVQL